MEDKLISVIVPIYNSEKFLERCLNSIKNQTHSRLQVILVDDGSNDSSKNICYKYTEQDARFEYYYQENSGVSQARNLGLRKARGDYIGFCDSDDWCEEDHYETLLKLCIDNNTEMSIDSFYIDFINRSISFYICDKTIIMSRTEAIRELCKGKLYQGHLWNKLIKKEIIGTLLFDTKISILEDELFLFNILLKNIHVTYRGVPKYHYFQNEDSAISADFKKSDWSRMNACKQIKKIINENCPELVKYINKKIISTDLWIAKKIIKNGKINKNDYVMLKKDISNALQQHENIPKKMIIEAILFKNSQKIFHIYIKFESILREMWRMMKK